MRIAALAVLLLFTAASLAAADGITVKGDVEHELHLSAAAIRELPHVVTAVNDEHSGKKIVFSGVWLSEVLAGAGVPLGEKLRGKALASYIVAEASDGYRVVFSLGEIDQSLSGVGVMMADAADGKPLDAATGPFRLVAPQDKRAARWVRQLIVLRFVKLP